MNNKKLKINAAHKAEIYKIYIGTILMFGLILYNITQFLMSDFDTKAIITLVFDLALLLIIGLLLILFINKAFCWIYLENGTIKRKGFLFGFKKEVKISDIKQIVIHNTSRSSFYYIIEENEELESIELFQECIHFTKGCDEHEEFLQSFWVGPIENYHDIKTEIK